MGIVDTIRRWAGGVAEKPGQAVGEPAGIGAAQRREAVPPDVALGKLRLWIGQAYGDGWLDVALVIGDEHHTVLEKKGPLIQKKSISAFEHELAELVAAEAGKAHLWSDGGSLSLTVTRYGGLTGSSCEVRVRHSIYSHKVNFGFAESEYPRALDGVRGVLLRFEKERRARRWAPAPGPRPRRRSGDR